MYFAFVILAGAILRLPGLQRILVDLRVSLLHGKPFLSICDKSHIPEYGKKSRFSLVL